MCAFTLAALQARVGGPKLEASMLSSKPVWLTGESCLKNKNKNNNNNQEKATKLKIVDCVCFDISSNECFLSTYWRTNSLPLVIAVRVDLFQIIQLPEV